MYMRTILYRFATDQPIPDLGVDVLGSVQNSIKGAAQFCALGSGGLDRSSLDAPDSA